MHLDVKAPPASGVECRPDKTPLPHGIQRQGKSPSFHTQYDSELGALALVRRSDPTFMSTDVGAKPTFSRHLSLCWDPWNKTAAGFLAVGFALRILVGYPVHKYVPDADALASGLRAIQILHGKLPVFSVAERLGAFECYMHAGTFKLFGVSRQAIAIAPAISGCLVLVLFFLFVCELLGRKAACLSLLFLSVPSPAYLYWTYLPNTYPETLLFCIATLWLAARVVRRGEATWTAFALGLSAGFGWWNSIQTIGCSAPALLWVLIRRPELRTNWPFWRRVGGGFILGAAPWILYNIRHPLNSFRGNFATRAVPGLQGILANAIYFFDYNIRELAIGMNAIGGKPLMRWQPLLRLPVAIAYAGGALLLVLTLSRRRSESLRRLLQIEHAELLPLFLVSFAVAALDIFSNAGSIRGLSVRYVLPLYFVISVTLALLVLFVCAFRRWAATLLVSAIIAFNVAGYFLPGTLQREEWAQKMAKDARLIQFLEAQQIQAVFGNYWVVYPLNFLAQGQISGLPDEAELDLREYEKQLPDHPIRWALLSISAQELQGWTARVGLSGSTVSIGGYLVYLPSTNPPKGLAPRVFLYQLRRSISLPASRRPVTDSNPANRSRE